MKTNNQIIEKIKNNLDYYKSISIDNKGFSIVEYTYINGIKYSIWIYAECLCNISFISTPNNQKYKCWNCKRHLYHSNFTQILLKEVD